LDTTTQLQHVVDLTQVAEARRSGAQFGSELSFDNETASNLAIVVTELATNLAIHAGGGRLLFRQIQNSAGERGLEILALDSGPGMSNVNACLRDGFSTAGTPGNGLGAIRRISRTFDIYSKPNQGTVVLAEIWPAGAAKDSDTVPRRFDTGAINLAMKGETVCGDSWAIRQGMDSAILLVIDGLGHGVFAAEASAAAVAAFRKHGQRAANEYISIVNDALRHTRGAAGAVAVIDRPKGTLTYCGIGNIAAVISNENGERHLVSHNGTLGHDAKVQREFVYPWGSSSLLIMVSDGLTTRWTLESYSGLRTRHPSIIAAVLFRDYSRDRDDATVVVLREGEV